MKMISRSALLLAGAAIALTTSPANAAELVVNGGFENGFTGWTQVGNTGFTGTSGTFGGVDPHGGLSQAIFGPVGSTGGLTQILNTVAGRAYNISVWAANLNGGTENFGGISFGGVSLGSLTNSPAFPYTNFTFTAIAQSAQTELRFDFRHDPSYYLLDDVSVSDVAAAVPEPATWGMMILGFGAIGGAMRRRQKVSAKVSFA